MKTTKVLPHQQVQSEGIRKQNMSKYLMILLKCCLIQVLVDLGKVQGGFSGVLGCFLKGLERGLEGSEEGSRRVSDASW